MSKVFEKYYKKKDFYTYSKVFEVLKQVFLKGQLF